MCIRDRVIAIDIWPVQWEIGVLDEGENALSPLFTVRNTGNVNEDILVRADDARSMPGEPVTTWTLGSAIGIDTYTLEWQDGGLTWTLLTKSNQELIDNLPPGDEETFNLRLTAPSAITTPARMWTRVFLTAVEH